VTKIDPPIPPKPGEAHHVVTNHTSGSRKINGLCARKRNISRGFCAHQTLQAVQLVASRFSHHEATRSIALLPTARWAETRLAAAAFPEHQVKSAARTYLGEKAGMGVRPSRALSGGEAGF
jgi:hypothetical protein